MSGTSRRTVQVGSISLIRVDGQTRRSVKYRFNDFVSAYDTYSREDASEFAKRLLDSQGLRPASGKASADIGRHLRSEAKAEEDVSIMDKRNAEAERDELWKEERELMSRSSWKAQGHAHWDEENRLLNERAQARKTTRPKQTKRSWNH